MAQHIYNDILPEDDESHQKISSYFLGPKAENYEWFKKNLLEILDSQRDARLDYFPKDGKFVTEGVQASTAYRNSTRRMTNAVRQAAYLLGQHSIPFWSPRYQAHIATDLSMPAILGYFMTMMYNPNNVSIEASPLTTVAEMTVGEDLCKMFGYNVDPENTDLPLSWGHLVSGGTVANLESVWVTRNLKFYPLSIRSAMKPDGPLAFIADTFKIQPCVGPEKLLKELSTWEMLNLKSQAILDIPERLYSQYRISPRFLDSVMKKYGIQSTSKTTLEKEFGVGEIKYLVANTKHYSWPKAAAVTGIGSDYMVGVKVDHGARVDLEDLREHLQQCLDNKQAVYAVVAIMGSTEEGAVDPLRGILKLRQEFETKGLSFLVHADAAWGGYFCTMLPQDYKPGEEIALPSEKGSGAGFVPDSTLRADTQEELFMLRGADSVTVDPHKAAYVPYPSGGLLYRDGRMRYLVTWTSPYISRGETTAESIGVFGIEGSKPGASAMATWLSNVCIGLGPNGYGKLLGEVCFTCTRLSAEWAAMSTQHDAFLVTPLNELPSELDKYSTPEKVEAEKQKIRDRILQKTNEEIVSEDESRPEGDKALALLRALGSDLNINAFSTNWRYADGTLNAEVEEANYFNQRVIQRLSVDSPEDDPTQIPFYLTSTTFIIHEYGECAQHFKKRLGLYVDNVDLVVMRNVVMSPWPTDGNFIARLMVEFKKVLNEEVQACLSPFRNDVSPTKHEFLLQGVEKVYIIQFPMFHLEKHRHQLIMEVKLSEEAMKAYTEHKKSNPAATNVLKTTEDVALGPLVAEKQSFKATIETRLPERTIIATDVSVTVSNIVKDRSLKGRFCDESYPTNYVPFYLYGTAAYKNIDHILVRSPNIQLSADNVQLDLDKPLGDDALSKGPILCIEGISEAAVQPFQSTEGPLGDTLASDSGFFFRPGQSFKVSVYEDPKDVETSGPGLADVSTMKLLGTGSMKLGDETYVDSVQLNRDPFELKEGDEKFKAWKKVFDQIGKELV
ncbi:MAG: hypothetical protein Q9163_004987 [Psora crenata]